MDEHLLAVLQGINRMHLMEKGIVPYIGNLDDPTSYHNTWNGVRKHIDLLPDDIKNQLSAAPVRPKRRKVRS